MKWGEGDGDGLDTPLGRQAAAQQGKCWIGIRKARDQGEDHVEHGEESQRVMYRKVEGHGTVSRNWLRIGRGGGRLCVAYTLTQGEKGITLKLKKCTFGKTSVKWFGRIFSADRVSTDLATIGTIKA